MDFKEFFKGRKLMAYCTWCGKDMQDQGDKWFCTNSDCINNVPHPKRKKKAKR